MLFLYSLAISLHILFSLIHGKFLCIESNDTEKFEDTKGAIRNHKSKKDIEHNGQKKNDKTTCDDQQNSTQKIKDRGTYRVTIDTNPVINHG